MTETEHIINELKAMAKEEKRLFLPRFFKTGKGQYGEGDIFLGVVVPDTRAIAKAHKNATLDTAVSLLASGLHEARLCGLLILVQKFGKAEENIRKEIFDLYLSHTSRINNWDLVDLTAPHIVGGYLSDKPRDILYRLARSPLLWDNRIAIVSTLTFIRANDLDETFALAEMLMGHPHDLMRKATGWMLREAGKKDPRRLYSFVEERRAVMPRTMLRYAIEKFSDRERKHLMEK